MSQQIVMIAICTIFLISSAKPSEEIYLQGKVREHIVKDRTRGKLNKNEFLKKS